ncbi:MAG: hypothetical protein AB1665_01200 [Candidatus Thermoplasmatota archaeon]
MNRRALAAAVLILLLPATALFSFFTSPTVGVSNQGPLFSKHYANYTLDLHAPLEAGYAFIIRDYEVTSAKQLFFDKIGIEGFRATGEMDESETVATYEDAALSLRIHNTPTAALELEMKRAGGVYIALAGGIGAIESGSGFILGSGGTSGVLVMVGNGTFTHVSDLILVEMSVGSKLVFRHTPEGAAYVSESVAAGRILAEMFISFTDHRLVESSVVFGETGVETVRTTNDTLSVSLAGWGGVLVLNVDRGLIPALDTRAALVSVDGQSAERADSAAELLWSEGTVPKYYIASDGEWLQVLVYIPPSAAHPSLVTIMEKGEEIISLDTVLSAVAAILVVGVAAAALYRR